jgi:hypothetical protein
LQFNLKLLPDAVGTTSVSNAVNAHLQCSVNAVQGWILSEAIIITICFGQAGPDRSSRTTYLKKPSVALHNEGRRYPELTSVVTFEDAVEVQVRREGLGAWINLDLYRKRRDIRCKHIILRNYCQSGLFGLQKGSRSPVIQYAAIHSTSFTKKGRQSASGEGRKPPGNSDLKNMYSGRRVSIHTRLGKRLIEEGLDAGGRAHTELLRGPACKVLLRAENLGWGQGSGQAPHLIFGCGPKNWAGGWPAGWHA